MPNLIDLHCDTLTAGAAGRELNDPACHLSLDALPREGRWAQIFAIFIPDTLRGKEAVDYYERHRRAFLRQMEDNAHRVTFCRSAAELEQAWRQGKTAAWLSVEGGCVLAGDLDRVALLAEQGVRCITLTWNGENELGSGHDTPHSLTSFGREAVREMERQGILVDVSHLNDAGFDDVLAAASRPFLASHSNARAVCPHRRNLSDGQIRAMVERECLVGLNYYESFLAPDGHASPEHLLAHIRHFLALGAENCLALGSDFDGARLPGWLDSPGKAASLADLLVKEGLGAGAVEKILYVNALDFLRRTLPG